MRCSRELGTRKLNWYHTERPQYRLPIPFLFSNTSPLAVKLLQVAGPDASQNSFLKAIPSFLPPGHPPRHPDEASPGSPRATWTPSTSLRDRCRVLFLSLRYISLIFAILSFGFLNLIWGWGTCCLDVVGKVADRLNFLHLAGSSRRLYWMRLSIGNGFLLAV